MDAAMSPTVRPAARPTPATWTPIPLPARTLPAHEGDEPPGAPVAGQQPGRAAGGIPLLQVGRRARKPAANPPISPATSRPPARRAGRSRCQPWPRR